MFTRRPALFLRICNAMLVSHGKRLFNSSRTSSGKERWDLLSAVCLERRPIVTAPTTDIEMKFQKLLLDIEYENSCKSNYEVRKDKERKQAELLKKGELDLDTDVSSQQTAQDLQDAYREEFSNFQCAERTLEADEKKDLTSLDRALDKYLILLVNRKYGNDYKWILPQGLREAGESMRQAAERVLIETCGSNLQAQFLGNAPCGFYKYKYPQSIRAESTSGTVGAKIFFFKAMYLAGQVESSKYKWLCQDDLNSSLQNDYYNSVSQFLIIQ